MSIKQSVNNQLYAESGGYCALCNQSLINNDSGDTINLGQKAHIIAHSIGGPRGTHSRDEDLINDEDNLILLCQKHHKEIDDNPDNYPVTTLKDIKRIHNERIKIAIQYALDTRFLETYILRISVPISNHNIPQIDINECKKALPFPMYINKKGDHYTIEKHYPHTDSKWKELFKEIKYELQGIADIAGHMRSKEKEIKHISVFANAPIPILIYVGSKLALFNINAFNYFRTTSEKLNKWQWRNKDTLALNTDYIQNFKAKRNSVCLSISISVQISNDLLESHAKIYRLDSENHEYDSISSEKDLHYFAKEFDKILKKVIQENPNQDIHLYSAVPIAGAITMGKYIGTSQNMPNIIIYQFENKQYKPVYKFQSNI